MECEKSFNKPEKINLYLKRSKKKEKKAICIKPCYYFIYKSFKHFLTMNIYFYPRNNKCEKWIRCRIQCGMSICVVSTFVLLPLPQNANRINNTYVAFFHFLSTKVIETICNLNTAVTAQTSRIHTAYSQLICYTFRVSWKWSKIRKLNVYTYNTYYCVEGIEVKFVELHGI